MTILLSNNNSEYLEQISRKLQTGFYQNKRLYLLDYIDPIFPDRTVFLPQQLINKTTNFDNTQPIENESQQYTKALDQQIKLLNDHLPDFKRILSKQYSQSSIDKITIRPAIFGPIGEISETNEFTIFPRFDRNPKQVLQLIVHNLYLKHNINAPKSRNADQWTKEEWEKEHLAVFEITKELLKGDSSLNNYKTDTFVNIIGKKSKGNLVKESVQNYNKIGYPVQPQLDLKKLKPRLTKKEILILKELNNNKYEITTFDRLSEVIWKEKATEKFSLYALTKRIQRIRDKLKINGLSENLIHTQRGKGYVLFD